jgi:hypothetical protein
MLTRIVYNSAKLCTFIDQLNLNLSKPQHQHILNLTDALLVCEDEKTLAGLQRQFIQACDASNIADFLRISPWKAEDVRRANGVRGVSGIRAIFGGLFIALGIVPLFLGLVAYQMLGITYLAIAA